MSINKLYFQKVQGIILMYDITDRSTYEKLPKWVEIINEEVYNIPLILIGNKLDDEENRIVRIGEGKAFAKENGFLFQETSAKSGKNVNNSMFLLCEKIISSLEDPNCNIKRFDTFDSLTIPMKKKEKSKTNQCC